MTEEIKNLSNKTNEEYDLQNTARYKKFWTSKQTECNWISNCLHWRHCDKETMEKMSSTLPHIQKVLISIGNTLTDSIMHNSYEFEQLITILNQQKMGGNEDDKNKNINKQLKEILEEISLLGKTYKCYAIQTVADELLIKLKSYKINFINLREQVLAEFKHLIINTESNDLKIELRQLLIRIEQLDSKNEITLLKEQIWDLQNDLTSLRVQELSKLKKLIEQNQQVINIIKSIDIRKLETTVHELNEKIPNIEPLLKEFERMFTTVKNIGSAIGYEE